MRNLKLYALIIVPVIIISVIIAAFNILPSTTITPTTNDFKSITVEG